MALITVAKKELLGLAWAELTDDELAQKITDLGMPVEKITDSEISVDVTPNRPDMFSVEGLASTMAGGMPVIYYELAIDKNGQPGLAFVDGAAMASFMEYAGVPQPWAAPRWLDNAAGGNHPRLAPSKNGGFHVVWDRGMEIWYARSTGGNLVDVSNTIGGSENCHWLTCH